MTATSIQEEILAGVQSALTADNYYAPVFRLPNCIRAADSETLPPFPSRGDAVIAVGAGLAGTRFHQLGLVYVQIDLETPGIDSVGLDYAGAVSIGTGHLIRDGRATYLVSPRVFRERERLAEAESDRYRSMGLHFRELARKKGVPHDVIWHPASGVLDTLKSLSRRHGGSYEFNLLAATEELAKSIHDGARLLTGNSARDLRLVSIGDDIGTLERGISSLRLPAVRAGEIAAELVYDRIVKPDLETRQLRLGPSFHIRSSS